MGLRRQRDPRDDEALVVTLNSLAPQYVGFDLTNAWLVSLEHIHGSGSLNSAQVQPNRDGTITYVIAAKDPGVYNWLSTDGMHAGNILIRWQALPQTATTADTAVQSVKLVKLNELNAALPADFRQVTAAERRQLVEQRVAAYAHRYATAATVAGLVATR